MYKWYSGAAICYAYLSDIMSSCPTFSDHRILPNNVDEPRATDRDISDFNYWTSILGDEPRDDDSVDPEELIFWKGAFCNCKWFTRGWTLQELLAPRNIKFYTAGWKWLGVKASLISTISSATRIEESILTSMDSVITASVAKRMSWAADRKTTRIEDEAYSLLGIMGVNMPLLYGEGSRAFARLQEEILKTSYDMSILAWAGSGTKMSLFATSASDFAGCHNIETFGRPEIFESTKYGITMQCPLVTQPAGKSARDQHLAILNCRRKDRANDILAIRLWQDNRSQRFIVGSERPLESSSSDGVGKDCRLETVDLETVLRAHVKLLDISDEGDDLTTFINCAFRLNVENAEVAEDFVHRGIRLWPSSKLFASQYTNGNSFRLKSWRSRWYPLVQISVLFRHACGYFGILLRVQHDTTQPYDSRAEVRVTYCKSDYEEDAMLQLEYALDGWKTSKSCGDAVCNCCSPLQLVHRAWDPTGATVLTASVKRSEIYGELFHEVQASFGSLSDMPIATDEGPQQPTDIVCDNAQKSQEPSDEGYTSSTRHKKWRKLAAIFR